MFIALRYRLLALALVSWLAACGPSVGGTGTGLDPVDLASLGAAPAPLCAANFAPALQCPVVNGAASAAPGDGTARVVFVDIAPGGQTRVVFEANGLELEANCLGLRFAGRWGVNGQGQLRFYGTYRSATSSLDLPALLSVQVQTNGTTLQISFVLETLLGEVILGPVTLKPEGQGGGPAAACP